MAPILAKTCAAAFPTSTCGKTKAVVVASFTKLRELAGKATSTSSQSHEYSSIHGTNGIFTYMKSTIHVGKYASHMDDMEMDLLPNGWKQVLKTPPKVT